jgi:glyoxylase-like metal-dependent hydrolase (beta-lactamase superfamily II)
MANLPLISETYKPVVCASTHFLEDMDIFLEDGVLFRMGDRWFEVIYMPGHSEDSIALWNEEEGLLFSGDANVIINTPGSSYNSRFIRAIEFLCRKDIKTIYFGHGEPMRSGAQGCPQALNGNDPGMHAKTRGCFVNVRQDKGPSEEKAFSITGIEGGIGNGQ